MKRWVKHKNGVWGWHLSPLTERRRRKEDLMHCKSDGSKIETCFIKIVLNTVVYDFCIFYPTI